MSATPESVGIWPSSVPKTEFSRPFVQGMLNGMAVSYYKYGAVEDAYPLKVDAIKSLFVRLACYIGTERLREIVAELADERGDGNTEWLIDAANFCQAEFMRPSHPRAHYQPTDSSKSPGRVWTPDEWDGSVEVSQRSNDGSPAV